VAKSSRKGSSFERDFCRQLSLWASGGANDDWYWRTGGSGARATVRGKKNKRTVNQHGDVAATCTEAQFFLDEFTLELKRGYNRYSLHDLLDKGPRAAKQTYEKWVDQARASARGAGSHYWMIVAKRDQRLPLALFSVAALGSGAGPMSPYDKAYRQATAKIELADGDTLVVLPLDRFFATVNPEIVRCVVNDRRTAS
jgi:hypothetical protein